MIHQRRAHKRILFEHFKKLLNQQKNQSQQLLFAQTIHLNNSELEFMDSIKKELNAFGFVFELKKQNLGN